MLSRHSLFYCDLQTLTVSLCCPDTLEDLWKFRYDLVWGGLFLRATNGELNFGVDYGFPYYNDHHFHLGYFLYAAAYYMKHHRSWGDGEATLWVGCPEDKTMDPLSLTFALFVISLKVQYRAFPQNVKKLVRSALFFPRISNSDYENHSTFISTSPLGKCPSFTAV